MHRHHWKTVRRNFTPPANRRWEIEGVSENAILAMQFGLTVVTQVCSTCGEEKHHFVPGDQTQI